MKSFGGILYSIYYIFLALPDQQNAILCYNIFMTTLSELRVTATITHLLKHDASSGYTIMRVSVPPFAGEGIPLELSGKTEITVSGILHGAVVGDRVRVVGKLNKHSQYGWQMQAVRMVRASLLRRAGAELVLKTLCFGRLTKEQVDQARLVCHDLESRLEQDTIEPLTKKGPNAGLLKQVRDAFRSCEPVRSAGGFLHALGLGPDAISRILAVYGTGTIDQVSCSPYRILGVPGIGFKTADTLATRLGFADTADVRISQTLEYTVQKARERGDTAISPVDLIESSSRLSGLDSKTTTKTLQKNVQRGRLSSGPGYVGGAQMVALEYELAQRLYRRIGSVPALPLGEKSAHLFDDQREAVTTSLGSRLSIVTGGPGVGKTTVTKSMLEALEGEGGAVLLAAPTGKAARRMTEATGAPAKSLHQLLEFNGGSFARNENNPLEGTALIIDEQSMVDVELMVHVLRAMPDHMRLYLVGDEDQLPSVDAGNVLGDIISSGVVPVVRLTQPRRTAKDSMIVPVAHSFLAGEIPDMPLDKGDFIFIEVDEGDEAIAAAVERAVTKTLPEMGFAAENIQVLTPQRTSPVGVQALNKQLQMVMNPSAPGVRVFGETFREGDPIMQVVNDYKRGLTNGQTGMIVHADTAKREVWAKFDDKLLLFTTHDLAKVRLSRASTIHKSQGSEYEAVVFPISESHKNMLTRRLVYTGLTRGKKQVIFIGTRKALENALQNTSDAQRNTLLSKILRKMGTPALEAPMMAMG